VPELSGEQHVFPKQQKGGVSAFQGYLHLSRGPTQVTAHVDQAQIDS
jgi:hypothetical protein